MADDGGRNSEQTPLLDTCEGESLAREEKTECTGSEGERASDEGGSDVRRGRSDEAVSIPSYAWHLLPLGVIPGLTGAFTGIIVPAMLSSLRPHDAARSLGIISGLASLTNAAAPLAGLLSDRLQTRRPMLLAGLCIESIAVVCMWTGRRQFIAFSVGSILLHLGTVCIVSMFNSVTIDWNQGDTELGNKLSGIWTVAQVIGGGIGFALAGIIFPIDKGDQTYIILLALCLGGFLPLSLTEGAVFRPEHKGGKGIEKGGGGEGGGTEERAWSREDVDVPVSKGWKHECTTVLFSSEYCDFRVVVWVRLMFFLGVAAITNNMLYFFEDRIIPSSSSSFFTADSLLATIALLTLFATVVSIYPSIRIANIFGTLRSTFSASILLSLILLLFPLLPLPLLFLLAILWGFAQALYGVIDLVLVGQCVVNEEKRARDIGLWSMAQALGAFLFGLVLDAVGKTKHKTEKGDRYEYSSFGYLVLFWAGGIVVFASSFSLFFIKNPLVYARRKDHEEMREEGYGELPRM